MNHRPFGKSTFVGKLFSVLALSAMVAGSMASLVSATQVYANNGLTVSASPNTGTLAPGQALEVRFSDPSGTTDAVADTCLVNGVETKDTFANLSPGLYHVTYTVGASDQNRAAGQVPIDCTLHQAVSIHVTAFDDGNTVAIEASSTGTTTPGDSGGSGTTTPPAITSNGTASQNGGLTATAVPASGTLIAGQSLEVRFGDPSGTTDAVADTCLVNGVETKDSFQNVSPGLYHVTYTVGASDASRAAGNIPIDCTLHQAASVHVVTFTDSNMVAIDPTGTTTSGGGSGGGTNGTGGSGTSTNPLSFSQVSISPNSGTSTARDTLHAFFQEASGVDDLSVMGLCRLNAVDVAGSFQGLGHGLYEVSYTVGSADGERPAGHTPIGCTLGDAQGTVMASAWNDGNTLAIDTNNDSFIDNGTSTLGFTVAANPSTGTLAPGDTLHISMQDPLPSGDVIITPSSGCRVNGVDVAPTYAYHGNGLYSVDYTVGGNDIDRAAGQIPFDCRLQNATGSVHLTYFTDNNTVAIDTSGSTGGTGTGTTTAGSSLDIAAQAVPASGTLTAGHDLEVWFREAHHRSGLILGGVCSINGVDVSSTFRDVTDGQYGVLYHINSTDAERPAGHIPVNCTMEDPATGSSTLIDSFSDGNTVAIDTNNDAVITEPTGNGVSFLASVAAEPHSGVLSVGDRLDVLMQEGNHDTSFAVGACTVNGVDVSSTFSNQGSGLYRVSYTVGASDATRGSGQIPVDCTLHTSGGQTVSTVFGFTDSNTVSIAAGGGGSGTTTPPGGDNTGGTTTAPVLAFDAVTAVPNTGTVGLGHQLEVHFWAPVTSNDITLDGSCTVNGVDVSSTFLNFTDGQYGVTYTVGAGDTPRAAGYVPVNCSFKNASGATTTISAFTDNNTVAIDPAADTGNGGDTGTTTPPGGDNTGGEISGTSTSPISIGSVTVDPVSGTLHQGAHVLTYIQETNHLADLSIGGACAVNGVTIHTLENLNNGLYRLDYTIGLNDTDRMPGTVPIYCALRNASGATTTISAFTDSNQVAIDSADDGIGSSTGGSVGGDVTGGADASLAVSAIDPVSTTAVAGGSFDHGWVWIIHATVPSNETQLSLKFSDWTHTNGTFHLATAGNMRISSPQASSTAPIDITAADTYSTPLNLTGDLDPNTPGRQIEVRVEMQVPTGTRNGSYTTSYGIRSSQ